MATIRNPETIKDNEVAVWSVAVGNIPNNPFKMRNTKKALEYIQGLDNFVGFHPAPPHGILCLFKTENDAKGARNLMQLKGIKCGVNICEVYIDKVYMQESDKRYRGGDI